jgi:uncharacterized RDD family membrane protein YckC
METATTHQMTDEPGVRFGLANAALVLALLVAGAAGLASWETELVTVLVAGLVSVGLPMLMSVLMGLISWAWFTGFFVNQYGQLTFADGDLRRLMLFGVATVALSLVARHRLVSRRGVHS